MNIDSILHIGSFLPPQDAAALASISSGVRGQGRSLLKAQFQRAYGDLPVLVASGFHDYKIRDSMEQLHAFRGIEGHKLFPPYHNYGGVHTTFKTKKLSKQNVFLAKDYNATSWTEIIKREPILKPNAGVLPEYWAVKPNIVAE